MCDTYSGEESGNRRIPDENKTEMTQTPNFIMRDPEEPAQQAQEPQRTEPVYQAQEPQQAEPVQQAQEPQQAQPPYQAEEPRQQAQPPYPAAAPVYQEPRRKKKKSGGYGRKAAGIVAAALLFGVVAGGTMAGVNMLAVADGRPETLSLKQIIEHHVDFQFELATRKYQTLLAKEKEKSEVQEGLIKACDVIDLIIEILRGSKSVKDARACLVHGITDNIRFKSNISKKMAALLRFTERQATAILEMRLYRLIGLEIEALRAEHEQTLKNIARYEDILNNYDSMAGVIMEELDAFKKEYGRKRRTVIENAEEAVFEEKKIEEQEVVFLMDRFGYAKTVDISVYERNKEAADSENKYVVHCMNTGRLCIFTDTGKMHQVKVPDVPHGRFRDKGTPIDNISNYSTSEEQIIMVCDAEQMRFAYLMFATAQGMIKKVEGTEFQVTKRTIVATKLQDGDSLIAVKVVNDLQNAVLRTKNGYFLKFPAEDIPVKKKAAVGVRGIRLQKKDELEDVYLFEEGTETKILYNEKEVTLNRLKQAKRDGAGTKYRG